MTAALEARVARLEAVLDAMLRAAGGAAPARAPAQQATPAQHTPGEPVPDKLKPGQVAGDRDMRSQYGDPPVFRDPYGWKGPSHQNKKFSACPADYLHALADDLDRFGVKLLNEGTPDKAEWKFRDAGRARAWALANATSPGQEALPGVPPPAQQARRPPPHDPTTGEYGGAQDFGAGDDDIPF